LVLPQTVDPQQVMSVSEVAARLGVRPRDVSDCLYGRHVPDEVAPLIGGRRLVRADALDTVAAALRRAGKPIVVPTGS